MEVEGVQAAWQPALLEATDTWTGLQAWKQPEGRDRTRVSTSARPQPDSYDKLSWFICSSSLVFSPLEWSRNKIINE